MQIGRMVILLAVAIGVTTADLQADEIRKRNGEKTGGNVQSISATEVTIGDSVRETSVPVNEIAAVVFTPEPRNLAEARDAYKAGRYADVLTALNEIKSEQIRRDEVKTEIEFYRAMAAARLAGFGSVDQKTATSAGMELNRFLNEHKNSHHFYEVNEALGDLLSAMKNANAFRFYDVIAGAPWPEYKIRAGLLKGRAAQMNGNHPAAIEQFDSALAQQAAGKFAEGQLQLAQLGKAVSLNETGKVDDAMKLVQGVIEKADPSDIEVNARAFNALGDCYRKKGANKDALLEYLKVDLLFSSAPDAHAEALYNLSQLWNEVQHPERARAALDTLKKRYATSRWNKG